MSKVFDELKRGLEQTTKSLPSYRGFTGTIEFSDEDGVFWGKVLGIPDSVTYDGANIEDLEKDFHDAVDFYLEDSGENVDTTGAKLAPGFSERCKGNGEDPRYEVCCDECDHFMDCYPEFLSDDLVGVLSVDVDDKKARRERLEDLLDLKAAEQAMAEHKKDPKTYTFDEVLEELGITREELDAMPDVELEQDGE